MWVCCTERGLGAIYNELAIPVRLQEATVRFVDFLYCADIADVDTIGTGANDRAWLNKLLVSSFILGSGSFGARELSVSSSTLLTVFLVQLMNIEWDLAVKPVVDVHKIRPFGDLGPRHP